MKMKHCPRCDQTLPVLAFYAKLGTLDGLDYRCRACRKATIKASEAKRPEHYRQMDRESRMRLKEQRMAVYQQRLAERTTSQSQ